MSSDKLTITDESVAEITRLLGDPTTANATLKGLNIRDFYVWSKDVSELVPFLELPFDSELKTGVIIALVNTLSMVVSTNSDPETRVIATDQLIDVGTIAYLKDSGSGIADPENKIGLPNRLLALIDNETDPDVKGRMLDKLVSAYYESVLYPTNRPNIKREQWQARVDTFIRDASHPLESIALLEAMVCRRSMWAHDGKELESIRAMYGLKDLLGIIHGVTDVDMRQKARKAAIATYNRVLQTYERSGDREVIHSTWTLETMDIVFPKD